MRPIIFTALIVIPAMTIASNIVVARSSPPPARLTQAEIAALAHNPAVQSAISACSDDRWKFCGGVLPGGGRILRCLAANSEHISTGCRSAIDTAAATVATARKAQ